MILPWVKENHVTDLKQENEIHSKGFSVALYQTEPVLLEKGQQGDKKPKGPAVQHQPQKPGDPYVKREKICNVRGMGYQTISPETLEKSYQNYSDYTRTQNVRILSDWNSETSANQAATPKVYKIPRAKAIKPVVGLLN